MKHKNKNKYLIKKWSGFLTEYDTYKEKLNMAKILEKQLIGLINGDRGYPLARGMFSYMESKNE